ncbi:MAG: hypothetical protein HQK54_02975 [Oligoflexales bacterium]|nr:hypothetical protein [Oligoflexales bacterium]
MIYQKKHRILFFLSVLAFLMVSCQDETIKNDRVPLVENSNTSIQLTKMQDSSLVTYELKSYSINNIVKNGATYTKINFSGGLRTEEKGFSEIPYGSMTLQTPDNRNLTIEMAEGAEYIDVNLEHPIIPSRGTIYRNQNPAEIPYEISDKSISDKFYPGNVVELGAPFVLRDIRGVTAYFYPFQYRSEDMVLRVYKKFSFKLRPDNSLSVNPLPANTRGQEILPLMNDMYKSVFVNYSSEESGIKVSETKLTGDILVIYTARDEAAIAPYVEWKTEKGFKVEKTQVVKGANVKTLIAERYKANPNLLYVLLVGDWEDIKSDTGPSSAPTDPMLGCVVGSDYYPDLIVGRFSGKNATDITIQVQKTINYEKNPEIGAGWYKKGLGIASDEGAGAGDDDEADYEHMAIIKNNRLVPFGYKEVFEAYKNPTNKYVSDVINGGVGIINYVGHGSATSWGTSGYSNTNIKNSTNGAMLPIIISVACVNGAFHGSSDSFAEAFLKKSGGGAVATLMSTINQPWVPPMRGQDYMNDLLIGGYKYGENPGKGINTTSGRKTFGGIAFNGMILMYTESSANSDLITLQTWTLFGDPSLDVRTEVPM